MKHFLLLTATATMLMAQTFTLNEIISELEQNHPALKSIAVQRSYLDASTRAQSGYDPLELSLTGAYAKEDGGNDGSEFSVALEQRVLLPGSNGHQKRALRYDADAKLLESQRAFTTTLNTIANSYHQSCLRQEAVDLFRLAEEGFSTQYAKQKRAYELGEIAKTKLLLIELELFRIQREAQDSQALYKATFSNLRSMLEVANLDVTALSCSDLISIEAYQPDFEQTLEKSFSQRAMTKQIESEKERYRYYDSSFREIGVSAGYDSELDTERVSVGVTIPLGFSSSTQEYQRQSAMQKRSFLQLRKSELTARTKATLIQELSLLNSEARKITAITASVEKYTSELLPLIYQSFISGESSAIEYLYVLREQRSLERELISAKESYYDKRFSVNTLLEIKE